MSAPPPNKDDSAAIYDYIFEHLDWRAASRVNGSTVALPCSPS